MEETATLARATDARDVPRTNMYVAAVLRGPDFATAVKLRNMSARGALVEATTVPAIGTLVNLVRGSLRVAGEVVWSAGNRCGLHFPSTVSARDWMAMPANKQQESIDHAVSVVKAGAVPLAAVRNNQTAGRSIAGCSAAQLASDLKAAVLLIDALGEALADDDNVVLRHVNRLQNLDIAVQTISAVASHLVVTDLEDEVGVMRLRDLRTSCAIALNNGR